MAESELNNFQESPFGGLGEPVCGNQFVGRQEYVKMLQENCTRRNFAIQGLPRVGKTSLACHSIINAITQVNSHDLPLCVLMFHVGSCGSAEAFFSKLCKSVYRKLKDDLTSLNDVKTGKRLDKLFGYVEDDEYEQDSIESFFENGISQLQLQLVIIMDEFDKVRSIFSGGDFASLRIILCVSNIHAVITSKRSIYDLENWKNDSSSGPSNLYQLFQGNTIFLRPFDEDEMTMYWNRLKPYFESIGLTIDDKYLSMAQYYAGQHPNRLNIFNCALYDEFKLKNRIMSEDEIGSRMKEVYDGELEMLKSVDLLSPAIQTIIGPEYDLNDKQLSALKEYGFVRRIAAKEKYKILGTSVGRLEKVEGSNELVSYVADSDYISLYIKSEFVNKVDFWPLWRDTFITLRRLAEKFFVDNWGDDWIVNAMQDENMSLIINKLRKGQKKDKQEDLTQSPLIEYLNETILDDLLNNEWLTFGQIFEPLSRQEFFEMFNYLKYIRNHEAHLNSHFFSDEERKRANDYLKLISDQIDAWAKKTGQERLVREKYKSDNNCQEFEFGKEYEGEVVIEDGKWRLVLCAHYPKPLRISGEAPWVYNANDKVFFKAQKKGEWWIAVDVRHQE